MGISAGTATLAVAAVVGAVVAVQQKQAADRRFEMAFKAADGLVRRVDSIQDLGVPETVLQALTRDANALLLRLTAESGADSELFHFRQAEAYLQSANIAKRAGQTEMRRDAIDKAVSLLVVLAGKDADGHWGWRQELANVYQMKAELLAESKDAQAAQTASRASVLILEELAQRPEAEASVRHDLANAYAADALRLPAVGFERKRLAALEKSLDLRRRVAAEQPHELEYQRSYAAGLSEIAEGRAQLPDATQADFATANAGHEAAIAAFLALAASKPLNRDLQQLLGTAHSKYGDTLVKQARFDDAMAEYNADIKITRAIADANPSYVGLQSDAAVAVSRLGILLAGTGKPAAALPYHREALERFKRVAAFNRSNEDNQENVFKRLMTIVDVARKADDLDGAIAAFKESVVFREEIAKLNPNLPDSAVPAIMQRVAFSKFLGDLNRPQDALSELKTARAALFAKKQALSNQESVAKMLAKLDANIAQMANAQK